jgi:hypothetical protein
MKPSNPKFLANWFFKGVLLLAILLLGTGCATNETPQPTLSSPTATQTHTPTPTIDWLPATATPTLVPSATPTPPTTLEDPSEGLGNLLIQDDFSNTVWWQTLQSESGNIAFGEGNLTFAVSKQESILTSLSEHNLPSNFYLEVTLQTSLCQLEDHIGIILWRESSSNYYQLLLNCAGQYRLELVQDGLRYVLIDWTGASQVQLGAPATNQLALWVYQGDLRFFINGAYQFTERVANDRTGILGIFAKTVIGPAMTVKFSDLAINQVELD